MALAMFYGNLFDSPFVVPVAGCIMILGIVVAGIWSGVRTEEMRNQERLAAIARGIPIPPTTAELALTGLTGDRPKGDLTRRRANIRLAGIVLLGGAAGLILFFVALAAVLQVRAVLSGAAAALIPFGLGIGFLVDTRIQSRELEPTSTTQL